LFVPNLNIGIEFNGCFWHEKNKKCKYFHQTKTIEALKIGIKLYHVWEDDYFSNKEKTLLKIKYLIENQPSFEFSNPILVQRKIHGTNRIIECWSEGITFQNNIQE